VTSKELKTLREKIAGLSSGRYYDSIYQWFDLMDQVVQSVCDGYHGVGCDCPQVYNDEGRGSLIPIVYNITGDPDLFVFWTYYRMPSGRWEIICYLT